jgi:hypothetical protein
MSVKEERRIRGERNECGSEKEGVCKETKKKEKGEG